jgi:hypothetical protein
MAKATLKIAWVRQGHINWEEWYVESHGHKFEQTGSLKEHVSFADFDLKRKGCPPITMKGACLEVVDVPMRQLRLVVQILDYHGFEVRSVSLPRFLHLN